MADGGTLDIQALDLVIGAHLVRGKANGQWLAFNPTRDRVAMNVGIDGEGFFIKNADRSATFSITLQQSSDSNDWLMAAFLAADAAPGGLLYPIMFSDIRSGGRTAVAGARAAILNWAPGTWSDGGEVRVWTLSTTRLEVYIGGLNPTPVASE